MSELREQILRWIEADEDKIVEFFSGLVRCKSPNPPGDTREAMSYMQHFLRSESLPFEEVNARDDWPNLISAVTMPRPGRHLMFNGHLDVFPAVNQPGWTDDPWSGKIANGRVWGRGTGDMKAGVTASTFAFAYLSRLRRHLKGKLSLTVVSDEESGGRFGVGHMFEKIEERMLADCVLSGESTTPRAVSFGGKGIVQFTVNVATPGAHASAPFRSANAIRTAMEIIRELDVLKDIPAETPPALAERLRDAGVRRQLGDFADYMTRTTLNIGTIQGGSKVNVIASDCRFAFEARIPIGLDPELIVGKAKEIVSRYEGATIEAVNSLSPDYCDPSGELATILQDTVESLGIARPVMIPTAALSDCKYWRDRGIPAYWYGPTPVAGTPNESVAIEEVLILVKAHALAAADYLSR
ncbi:M20/M25/M40 family metallo-hydrolase [Geminicoccaceae bacterium 1502E]|nr:M20/M25/M40 family metallo-hydrolase [Geminicoccaceae bacterium 1502E]